jgi:hypothetical protein
MRSLMRVALTSSGATGLGAAIIWHHIDATTILTKYAVPNQPIRWLKKTTAVAGMAMETDSRRSDE